MAPTFWRNPAKEERLTKRDKDGTSRKTNEEEIEQSKLDSQKQTPQTATQVEC